MTNYIEKYLTDSKYKDRWIMIHLPNASSYDPAGREAFANKYIKGFLQDDKYTSNYGMDTGDSNVDVVSDVVGQTSVGADVAKAADKVFNDLLTYGGASNTSNNFTFTVIPGVGGNMGVEALERFLSYLVNPEPYTFSVKALGGNNYKSYITEFNTLTRVVDSVTGLFSADDEANKDKDLSNGLVHVHVGDNIHFKGCVVTDSGASCTMLRDEEGQFYGYEISMTIVPYKKLDGDQSYMAVTNKNAWSIV